jgi:hypothetical protein
VVRGLVRTSYLTQFIFVAVTGRVIGKQATTSKKHTHTQLVTLTTSPHFPRLNGRPGSTRERPLQAMIPCGITYEVIMKTMFALTIEAKAVVDPRKINP